MVCYTSYDVHPRFGLGLFRVWPLLTVNDHLPQSLTSVNWKWHLASTEMIRLKFLFIISCILVSNMKFTHHYTLLGLSYFLQAKTSRTYTHTFTHAYIYTYTYINTYIHTYTQIHKNTSSPSHRFFSPRQGNRSSYQHFDYTRILFRLI